MFFSFKKITRRLNFVIFSGKNDLHYTSIVVSFAKMNDSIFQNSFEKERKTHFFYISLNKFSFKLHCPGETEDFFILRMLKNIIKYVIKN